MTFDLAFVDLKESFAGQFHFAEDDQSFDISQETNLEDLKLNQ